MFKDVYDKISKGTDRWNALNVEDSKTYSWKESSYINDPPFFKGMTLQLPKINNIVNARCLLNLGDSVTTDHISPAGKISLNSPAANYLKGKNIQPNDFNTYGARRGNDEIMTRGTFANIRLMNKIIGKQAPLTKHFPTNKEMAV